MLDRDVSKVKGIAIACDVTDPEIGARRLRQGGGDAMAASTSSSPTPALPGRAASAMSRTRSCAKASS